MRADSRKGIPEAYYEKPWEKWRFRFAQALGGKGWEIQNFSGSPGVGVYLFCQKGNLKVSNGSYSGRIHDILYIQAGNS